MPKQLKTHAASFKFKVVLESFTTNNVAETARKYSLNANQLSRLSWPLSGARTQPVSNRCD
jgi:transposase-like protein